MARRILRTEGHKPEESLGKYVYCVIEAPEEKKCFGNLGFGGQEVYTLEYKDITPVISDADFREYAVNEEECYSAIYLSDTGERPQILYTDGNLGRYKTYFQKWK